VDGGQSRPSARDNFGVPESVFAKFPKGAVVLPELG
jgi:hypothetical protein